MRHVFRWQRVMVLLPVLAIFATLPGTAGAVTVTGTSGSVTCQSDALTGATKCTFSATVKPNNEPTTSTVSFNAEFGAIPVVEPSLCPAQLFDPMDTVCEHLLVETTNIQGTATVSLEPSDADLDICVYDTKGTLDPSDDVAVTCGTSPLSFDVTCGTQQYEVRISAFFPGFLELGQTTIVGGSTTVTATPCGVVLPPPGGGGSGGGGNPAQPGHKVTGGGQTAAAATSSPDATFAVNVIEEADSGTSSTVYKGKVRVATKSCDFRSVEIIVVFWEDGGREAVIQGKGTFKSNPNAVVNFEARVRDGGEGQSNEKDEFFIDKCTSSDKVANGNTQYHIL